MSDTGYLQAGQADRLIASAAPKVAASRAERARKAEEAVARAAASSTATESDRSNQASAPLHAFDGTWKVTFFNVSGCANNATRSYNMRIRNSTIHEPKHSHPKKGLVSAGGIVSIAVYDKSGNRVATQSVRLKGDQGVGSLRATQSSCKGSLKLVRLN